MVKSLKRKKACKWIRKYIENGKFKSDQLPLGEYNVKSERQEYNIKIQEDKPSEVNFYLKRNKVR